jgi:hypothetical protein
MAGDVGRSPDTFRRHNGPQEELVAAADRTFNRTARTVGLRLAEMKAHLSILEERMTEALRDPRDATADEFAVAEEVMAHLRSLPESDRSAFIAKAVDEDDRRTVAAVLSAPPLLSGIGSETSRTVRDQAARRWASVEHEQAGAIASAIERVMTALELLALHYASMLELAKSQRTQETMPPEQMCNAL